MASSTRTCTECGTDFYGRADALYCSNACRMRSYRGRSRNARLPVTPTVDAGPVPIGDEWMTGRFGGQLGNDYTTVADMTEIINARYKTDATRQKHLDAAVENGLHTIRTYVEDVAAIARYTPEEDDGQGGGVDLHTPLGDTLPLAIDPITAADLAAQLEAAIPRVVELAALLRRRAA